MTSGWPWMKGCPTATAEEPKESTRDIDDDRPSVTELFEEHRHLIDEVAAELGSDPLFDVSKHDDLWILRFLMSHKKRVKAAVKSAKFTLSFRNDHRLDQSDVRSQPPRPDVDLVAVQRFLKHCTDHTFSYFIPDADRGVVIGILQLAGIDQEAVMEHVDESDWLACFLYIMEWSHQCLDYTTRNTGRLTKSIRIIDVTGVTLGKMHHDAMRRFGKIMHLMEDCYPQLLQTMFVCHAPSWVQTPWRTLRPLFPKRVVGKFDFIAPHKCESERKRLLKYIALEHLPVRYGGKNEAWPLNFPLTSASSVVG
jgi:CRAL/TRIO domain